MACGLPSARNWETCGRTSISPERAGAFVRAYAVAPCQITSHRDVSGQVVCAHCPRYGHGGDAYLSVRCPFRRVAIPRKSTANKLPASHTAAHRFHCRATNSRTVRALSVLTITIREAQALGPRYSGSAHLRGMKCLVERMRNHNCLRKANELKTAIVCNSLSNSI